MANNKCICTGVQWFNVWRKEGEEEGKREVGEGRREEERDGGRGTENTNLSHIKYPSV